MYRKKIDTILSQEVTRQEFLKASGGVLLVLLGLPSIVKTLTKAFHAEKPASKKTLASGYGDRPYGR